MRNIIALGACFCTYCTEQKILKKLPLQIGVLLKSCDQLRYFIGLSLF